MEVGDQIFKELVERVVTSEFKEKAQQERLDLLEKSIQECLSQIIGLSKVLKEASAPHDSIMINDDLEQKERIEKNQQNRLGTQHQYGHESRESRLNRMKDRYGDDLTGRSKQTG